MTQITMEDVSKYFDDGETVANYRLNLEVEDGEFIVFLGPSGCGKTTALRLVAGLEDPSEERSTSTASESTVGHRATETSRWCSKTTRCIRI